MRIAVASDERTGVAEAVVEELRRRGHDPIVHGALAADERPDWAWASEAAARDVVEGRADQAVVCCWTGTGASIAANKVAGVRAALCGDGPTAAALQLPASAPSTRLHSPAPAIASEIVTAKDTSGSTAWRARWRTKAIRR